MPWDAAHCLPVALLFATVGCAFVTDTVAEPVSLRVSGGCN